MAETWRLLDTGLGSAARNIALNRALLEARQADEIPSTLRFLRFTRSALLGYDQSALQAVNLDHCRLYDIALQRRLTGGPALYVDEKHLGWELYLHRRDVGCAGAHSVPKRVCHAVATALSALGLDARYRARSEIEVGGRTIASGGIAVDSDALLFQGVLALDLDAGRMVKVLRTPAAPLGDAALALCDRFTSLAELLPRGVEPRMIKHNVTEAFESEFDVEFREGDLSLSEERRFEMALREIDTQGWVDLVARPASEMPVLFAVREVSDRLLRAALLYDSAAQTIRQVWFSTEVNAHTRRRLMDLEAALRDVATAGLSQAVATFFAGRPSVFAPLAAHDFIAVVRLALQEPLLAGNPPYGHIVTR